MGTGMTPRPRDFLDLLEQSRPEIAKLLPDPKQVDRVVRIVRSAWQSDEKIRACDPVSIISSVMKACELDLEPGGAQKHAYLVPYKTACQLIIGYAGLLKLARESEDVAAIGSRAVKEHDEFDYTFSPEPSINHRPFLGADRGQTTHVYAYLRHRGTGELSAEVMTFAEVEHVRVTSKAGPIWHTYWDEMARKTVLKRMLKTQELMPKAARAIAHDNATVGLGSPHGADDGRGRISRSDALAEQLQLASKPTTGPDTPTREPGED